ncbi:MAG: hypothetical protein Q9183_002058 [Haloplaca sp. 2 TL-2023]
MQAQNVAVSLLPAVASRPTPMDSQRRWKVKKIRYQSQVKLNQPLQSYVIPAPADLLAAIRGSKQSQEKGQSVKQQTQRSIRFALIVDGTKNVEM